MASLSLLKDALGKYPKYKPYNRICSVELLGETKNHSI